MFYQLFYRFLLAFDILSNHQRALGAQKFLLVTLKALILLSLSYFWVLGYPSFFILFFSSYLSLEKSPNALLWKYNSVFLVAYVVVLLFLLGQSAVHFYPSVRTVYFLFFFFIESGSQNFCVRSSFHLYSMFSVFPRFLVKSLAELNGMVDLKLNSITI